MKERLVDKNGWQHYAYQAGKCELHDLTKKLTGVKSILTDV